MTFNFKKQIAFTLTEVLITLTIIGVIAALTLPNLMAKYQEQVTVTKVKKFYNNISNAYQMALSQNGNVEDWGFTDISSFMAPINANLKITKDCKTKPSSGCVTNITKHLDGTANPGRYDEVELYYKSILEDGTAIFTRLSGSEGNNTDCNGTEGPYDNVCAVIAIDITGVKGPNVIGKDIFNFSILKNQILPYHKDLSYCGLNTKGWGCSQYILFKGNMDYLRK